MCFKFNFFFLIFSPPINKYNIKPEKLESILKEWEDNDNNGCLKEYQVNLLTIQVKILNKIYFSFKEIITKDYKYIQENSIGTHVALKKENVAKNRYKDILACKLTFLKFII